MSSRIYGEIDRHPWVTLNVVAEGGTQEIKFLVDTGFDGELVIPKSLTPLFGTSSDFFEVDFADGDREQSMIVQCRVQWLEGYREVTALYTDGSTPLLGMELLDDCTVTLENGGDERGIIIEGFQ